MDTKIAARLLRRGLEEKLAEYRKSAFVPMGSAAEKTGQQAPGPGGEPVDPMAAMGGAPPAGGAPMDPMAAGGAPPMDPAMAGGAPPADPMAAAAGGAPMDPMAAMGGAPPMDPMAAAAPPPALDAGAPPPPLEGGEGDTGGGLTKSDAETVDTITRRTMDIVRETLEMVGKTKQPKQDGQAAQAEPDPKSLPGPVTGQPGFDPSMISGPLKMAAVTTRRLGGALKLKG